MTTTLEHGTYAAYQRPCRCEPCKAAAREYQRGWRMRVRGSLAPEDPRHGTTNGHDNFGCRCALCCYAHHQAMADYYLRRARVEAVRTGKTQPTGDDDLTGGGDQIIAAN